MPSQTKIEKVAKLKDRLSNAEATVFADFRGLTVQDADELRTALAEADATFAIVKNSLARIAVKEAELEGLDAFIDGPTAIAFVQGDLVAATKKLVDAAKKFPVLELRGGWGEGRILSSEDVKALAALESREAMLAKIAGLAKSQMSRAAFMMQALQSTFLSLLDAYKEKVPPGEAPAEAPAAEEPAAEEPAAEAEAPAAEGPAAEEPAAEAPATEAEAPAAEEAPEANQDESDNEQKEGGS